MKTVIKTSIGGPFLRFCFILTALALPYFAFLPGMQAVVPAPDGGYAGNNTAEGTSALFSLTSGIDNTAIGFQPLFHNTTGSFNTGEGFRALFSNTTGAQNTANGVNALTSNTTGNFNTADGVNSLFRNTTGAQNTASGVQALFSNTIGVQNTANGVGALFSNTTGSGNVAIGFSALSSSTVVGVNSPDGANVAIGPAALQNTNGTGTNSGGGNNAVGQDALRDNANGFFNNAFGSKALFNNTTGVENTACGANALLSSTTGGGNTALGALTLSNNTTGVTNTAVGFNVTTADNVIVIGTNVGGENVDHSCFIGEIFGETSSAGTAVFINANGRLGTATSSQRFKDGIKPMDKASETLFALKPVTFRYKKEIDPKRTSQFGLVAEDVEKVDPALVVRDKEGKPYSVRYNQVNAMLLNEFLKEHREVEKQQATIAGLKSILAQQRKDFEVTATQQQKEIQALTASLKEQASQIQKVSAQLEVSKLTPQVAVSEP